MMDVAAFSKCQLSAWFMLNATAGVCAYVVSPGFRLRETVWAEPLQMRSGNFWVARASSASVLVSAEIPRRPPPGLQSQPHSSAAAQPPENVRGVCQRVRASLRVSVGQVALTWADAWVLCSPPTSAVGACLWDWPWDWIWGWKNELVSASVLGLTLQWIKCLVLL